MPYDDELLGEVYKPSIGLQQRKIEDELRQLREKAATPSVTIGSGSFAQVEENISASGVNFAPTVNIEQTAIETITPAQDEALIALITVLKGLIESNDLDGENRAKARGFAHDIEVAKRVDPQDTPGLLKRVKTWADGLGAVAQSVTQAVAAVHALGIPLPF